MINLYLDIVRTHQANAVSDADIANKMLYMLCGHPTANPVMPKGWANAFNKEYLSAQLLMIGRVYSAQFDRRHYNRKLYGKDFVSYKTKHASSPVGKGTGDFYDALAERLTAGNTEQASLYQAVIGMLNASHRYYGNRLQDIEVLRNTVIAVSGLSALIGECITEYDLPTLRGYEATGLYKRRFAEAYPNEPLDPPRYRNICDMISACSKFLHFHFPTQVFIIDQFANSHLGLFQCGAGDMSNKTRQGNRSEATLRYRCPSLGKVFDSRIREKDVKALRAAVAGSGLKNCDAEYLDYVCRAYLVGEQIHAVCAANPSLQAHFDDNAPRIVDMLAAAVNTDL